MKKTLMISCLSGLMIAFSSVVTWASVAVSGSTVDVFAYNNSSSGGTGAETGIIVTAGDSFSVIAGIDDLWSAGANPRWSNANGLVGYLYATGADQSGSPSGTLIGQNFGLWSQSGLSAPYGSLVGEIDGLYALLGTSFQGAAWGTGLLRLFYWDSNYLDNQGSISVTVSKSESPVPVPSTMVLFGTGIAGLAGIARRKRD